ncbi:MAG: hypothetical protein IKO46_11840 [Salinivirgaceae bacterium]|nr:hypothetical protein [Salinivirgaceae bacterium]
MKTLKAFLTCALMATTIIACDKNNDDNTDDSHLKDLPENIQGDFSSRYPDAKVDGFCLFGDSLNMAEIDFYDKDGLSNMAYYKDGKWLSNRKKINLDADSDLVPEKVHDTFSKLGIPNEQIIEHIFEDSKSGIEQKQYQFAFVGTYNFGMGEIGNYANNIIIAEDGTLLSHNDYQLCDPVKIVPYDHTEFIQFAQSKYPEAKILGSTYDGRNVVVFISHEKIVKHVVIYKDDNNKLSWVKTWYPLDINTNLPESAIEDKNDYLSQHPDAKLTAIRYEEDATGAYYCFTFYLTIDSGEIISSKIE